MKNTQVFNEIKSKYILEQIFDYIKDDKFKMKLFYYSKLFQSKLNLSIIDYQIAFLNKINFDYNNYLKFSTNTLDQQNFDPKYLISQFTEDILKYNINSNIIPTIINNYFRNNKAPKIQKKNKNNINFGIEIDIFSPYFDFLSKDDIFNNFCIIIPLIRIKKFDLINDYKHIFAQLAQRKSDYNSIILYTNNNDDLELIKNLGINFNQILKLSVINLGNQIYYNDFFNILFSPSLYNTLLYLSLKKDYYQEIKPENFTNINNFNILESLSLDEFRFTDKFILKIKSLKTLFINECENITLDEITCINLKKLYIYDSNIYYYESTLLKLPNVEECELIDRKSEISHYNYLIDFGSLKSLKLLKAEDTDFYELKNAPVEIAKIYDHSFSKRTINIKLEFSDIRIMRKIISIQTLKKICFIMSLYNRERLFRIKDKNHSINDMEVYFNNFNNAGDFMINFLNYFPNLTKLSLGIRYTKRKKESGEYILGIIENNDCHINDIKIIMANNDVNIFCGPFEKMEKFDIECLERMEDIKAIIPIFNNNCNRIFQNLKYFRFVYHDSKGINSDFLNILSNNISLMPKLKTFEFRSSIDDKDSIFKNLEEKLLSLNLEKIILSNTFEGFHNDDEEIHYDSNDDNDDDMLME